VFCIVVLIGIVASRAFLFLKMYSSFSVVVIDGIALIFAGNRVSHKSYRAQWNVRMYKYFEVMCFLKHSFGSLASGSPVCKVRFLK